MAESGSEPPDLTTQHVRGALAGEARSVEWIVARFSPVLRVQAEYRLDARLRAWVDPGDVVNQVWLKALPRLTDFTVRGPRATPPFLRFLAHILLNEVNSLYRKRIRGDAVALDISAGGPAEPAESARVVSRLAAAEMHDEVVAALAELTPDERELIVLRGIEQHPPREIGMLLGLKPNTVSVRYRRAIDKLRRRLPDSVVAELPDDAGGGSD